MHRRTALCRRRGYPLPLVRQIGGRAHFCQGFEFRDALGQGHGGDLCQGVGLRHRPSLGSSLTWRLRRRPLLRLTGRRCPRRSGRWCSVRRWSWYVARFKYHTRQKKSFRSGGPKHFLSSSCPPEGDGTNPILSPSPPSLCPLPPSPLPAEVAGRSPGDAGGGGLPFPAPWTGGSGPCSV
jgi:hypothetical protein